MNVAIIGCGRTGSRLANDLDERGYDVSVVDSDRDANLALRDDFGGIFISGDPCDINVLKNGGVDNADIAIVLTKDDNVNVMVARIIKEWLSVEKVLVRVLDPTREKVFRSFGLSTICPTRFEKDWLYNFIINDIDEEDTINLGGSTIKFVAEKPNKKQIGLYCSEIITKNSEMIFGLRKSTGEILLYNEELVIEEGDSIIRAINS